MPKFNSGWVALLACVGCGGPSEPAKPVTMEGSDAALPSPTGTTSVAKPKPKLGVPRDPAVLAVGDLSVLFKITPLTDELSRSLGTTGDLKAALGFDPTRPAVLVMPGPTDQALVDELRGLAAAGAGGAQYKDVCPKVHDRKAVMMRVLLPATNVDQLENAVGTLLEKEDNWHHTKEGYSQHSLRITLSEDDAYVAIDLAERGYLTMTGADQPIPSLDGAVARMSTKVSVLANFGLVTAITTTCGAISGDSVDASQKARIFAEGVKEALGNLTVATFDKIEGELALSPPSLTLHATPGPSVTLPGPDAFAPGLSVDLANAKSSLETSTALVRAWPFPGGSMEAFRQLARDGGGFAILAGLPHLMPSMAFAGLSDRTHPFADPNILRHFERIQAVETDGTVAVGVLPAGTTAAAAGCSLEPSATCGGKQLKVGVVTKRVFASGPDRFAKLVELKVPTDKKPRYALLVATDDAALTPAATARTASGSYVDIRLKNLPPQVQNFLPFPVSEILGEGTVANGQAVMKFTTK